MLDRARQAVADSAEHLRCQEARVFDLGRQGRQNAESAKLLRNMRQAHENMIKHVRLLESELQPHGEAAQSQNATDDLTPASQSKMMRLIANEDN